MSGGIERGVVEINDYLLKNGFNSVVLSSGGKLVYQIEQSGGKHITLDVATKNPFKMWKNVDRIKKIIEENNIDLVHVRSRAPAWSTYFACKKTKCPLVSTMHGNYSIGKAFLFSYFKRLYNSSMVRADWIICVSNYIKDYAYENYKLFRTKFAESKTRIIHRGVDVNIFDSDKVSQERIITLINKMQIPEDKQIILLPGRLTEWKGQMYFLDVLAKVKNRNFICIIVGDSKGHEKYRDKLKDKIKSMKLSGMVRLESHVYDMAAGYMVSNIVVSSSIRGEAFGRVIPEAQAMERMVIATSIGGSLETVVDGETGYLVDPNDKDKFASIIDKILDMPTKEREAMGKNARKHIVQNYTTEKMCSKTADLYREALEEKNK